MTRLVWLITGTSSGIGRDLTLAALQRGDSVIATSRARSLGQLVALKEKGADVLELDVTSPLETLHGIAKQAVAIHGHIDVVVNNAGYVAVGAIEENTEKETFDQFNTNVFGALNVARAFLPYMRERKSGTIIWIGSLGGWRPVINAGLYAGTKYAVRGLSETLDAEISPLGLRSITIELGYFRTELLTTNNRAPYESRIVDYKEISAQADARFEAVSGKQPGDPRKAAEVIVDIARREGAARGREVPSVLALGSDCHTAVLQSAQGVIARLEAWEDVARSTDFPKGE
ncbi:short chain dehydrogenase [Gloeopeniophorella convolvens]|nr:short chain dehydrogenase [Gloeopeniophorella convolvens]